MENANVRRMEIWEGTEGDPVKILAPEGIIDPTQSNANKFNSVTWWYMLKTSAKQNIAS